MTMNNGRYRGDTPGSHCLGIHKCDTTSTIQQKQRYILLHSFPGLWYSRVMFYKAHLTAGLILMWSIWFHSVFITLVQQTMPPCPLTPGGNIPLATLGMYNVIAVGSPRKLAGAQRISLYSSLTHSSPPSRVHSSLSFQPHTHTQSDFGFLFDL